MNKKALEMMKQAISMMEEENYPASDDARDMEKGIQGAMDMGAESPNKPNLEDDAMAKDQGGFEDKKKRIASVVAMMQKKG